MFSIRMVVGRMTCQYQCQQYPKNIFVTSLATTSRCRGFAISANKSKMDRISRARHFADFVKQWNKTNGYVPIPARGVIIDDSWPVRFHGYNAASQCTAYRSRANSAQLEPWELWMLNEAGFIWCAREWKWREQVIPALSILVPQILNELQQTFDIKQLCRGPVTNVVKSMYKVPDTEDWPIQCRGVRLGPYIRRSRATTWGSTRGSANSGSVPAWARTQVAQLVRDYKRGWNLEACLFVAPQTHREWLKLKQSGTVSDGELCALTFLSLNNLSLGKQIGLTTLASSYLSVKSFVDDYKEWPIEYQFVANAHAITSTPMLSDISSLNLDHSFHKPKKIFNELEEAILQAHGKRAFELISNCHNLYENASNSTADVSSNTLPGFPPKDILDGFCGINTGCVDARVSEAEMHRLTRILFFQAVKMPTQKLKPQN